MPTAQAVRAKRRRIAALTIAAVFSVLGYAPADAALAPDSAHDLTALKIFSRAVVQVHEHYVDPRRIDPKEMIVSALDYVEKTVAEVMVDGDAKSGKLKVTVGSATKDFDISDINNIFKIPIRLRDIFSFIRDNVVPDGDTREVEYAAVNGMLSTLDPHSVLLKPDVYKEMKLQTKGEFGGLGFVISMREGQLTVMKVLKDTPAHRGGVKARDQILKIDEESTVNMELNDAVNRLRGKPGTRVNLTIARKGWDKPKRFELNRAQITVETVVSHLLDNKVGYLRITNFSGSTDRDAQAQIAEMRRQGKGELKGLVLDLRNNPGGLLEQAIKITDMFVDQGNIVTTVGMSDKLREPKAATRRDSDDLGLPMVVLVNSNSASASEIVSGALKNLGRAVVVGKQTYGKGSVQVLYELADPPAEESALKLTIAQYLTPGDISIQEVGVSPDIELLPARVSKERVSDLFSPAKVRREADLARHFGQGFSEKGEDERPDIKRPPAEKPMEQIRYLAEEPKAAADGADAAEEDDELDDEDPDEKFSEDWPITFAREMIAAAPVADRQGMLQAARPFLVQKENDEKERIKKAIEALGVPWNVDPDTGAPAKLASELKANGKTLAGETFNLVLSAQNQGTAPLHRLRAWTDCENPIFDRREFLIGSLKPGEKRSWTVPVKVPAHFAARRDVVTVKFQEEHGHVPEDLRAEVDVMELPRPSFAFAAQVVDTEKGNGDGRANVGEEIAVDLEVKNTGAGKAHAVSALIKNLADEKVFILKGRQRIGEMKAGESKVARLTLEVKKGYTGATLPLKVTILDEDLDEYLIEKIELPVAGGAPVTAAAASGGLKLVSDGEVRTAPDAAAPVLANAKKGAVLVARSRVGDFYRVDWARDRMGFVAASAVRPFPARAPSGKIAAVYAFEEPRVTLVPEASKTTVVTDADRFTLAGQVRTAGPLKDVYVFVNDQKVFFKTVGQNGTQSLDFTTDFPLKPGNNVVAVIARSDEDLATRRTLVVHRGGGQLAEAPGKPKKAK